MTTTDTPPTRVIDDTRPLFDVNGLNFAAVGPIDHAEWDRMGAPIQLAATSAQMWAGDWLNYGFAHFDEALVAAGIDPAMVSPGTISQWRWVARKVPYEIRRLPTVRYSIHRLVAELDDTADMDRALRIAERDGLTYRQAEALVRAMKTAQADRRAAAAGEDMPGRPPADEEFPTDLSEQWRIPEDEPAGSPSWDEYSETWTVTPPAGPAGAPDSPVWRLSWALPPELADLGPEVAAATEAALRAEYARLGVDPDSLIAHEWPHHNDDES